MCCNRVPLGVSRHLACRRQDVNVKNTTEAGGLKNEINSGTIQFKAHNTSTAIA